MESRSAERRDRPITLDACGGPCHATCQLPLRGTGALRSVQYHYTIQYSSTALRCLPTVRRFHSNAVSKDWQGYFAVNQGG